MTALAEVVRRASGVPEPGSPAWLASLTDEQRAAVLRGDGLPRRRPPAVVKLEGCSLLPGRCGISIEASELFDALQEGHGPIALHALRAVARIDDLLRLVAELAHYGLVDRAGTDSNPIVSIVAGYEDAIVVSGGWRRWG